LASAPSATVQHDSDWLGVYDPEDIQPMSKRGELSEISSPPLSFFGGRADGDTLIGTLSPSEAENAPRTE
jgi:hypothetical protein